MGHSDREGDGGRWDGRGRAANLSFDLRLGFTTGEIYSDTNAHKVALWLAKPTGGLEGSSDGRRICVASSRIYLTSLHRRAAGGDLNTLGGV